MVGARKIHMCTKVPRTRSSGFENWFSKNQHAYKRDYQAFSAGFPDGEMLIIATTFDCPHTRKDIWKPVKYWYHPVETIVTSPKGATMQLCSFYKAKIASDPHSCHTACSFTSTPATRSFHKRRPTRIMHALPL